MRPLQALAQGLLRGGFAAQVLLVSILKPLIFRSEYEQIGLPDLQELAGTLEDAIQDFQPEQAVAVLSPQAISKTTCHDRSVLLALTTQPGRPCQRQT